MTRRVISPDGKILNLNVDKMRADLARIDAGETFEQVWPDQPPPRAASTLVLMRAILLGEFDA